MQNGRIAVPPDGRGHLPTAESCFADSGSRQQPSTVARPTAEDAEIRMTTVSTFDDQSAVGVPRLVHAPGRHCHNCTPATDTAHLNVVVRQ